MVRTQALWDLVESEGIRVEWWAFHRRLGMYVRRPDLDKPLIVLRTGVERQERTLRTILAHELGHHFTTAGEMVVALDFNGQVLHTKAERLANKWAARFLLGNPGPPVPIGASKVSDAADALMVEPWLVRMALQLH